jgi:hypothetical protein
MSEQEVVTFIVAALWFALGLMIGSCRKRVDRVETVMIGWNEQFPKHWTKKGGEQ